MTNITEDLAKLLGEHAAYETDEDDHARCVGCGTLVCGQYAPHSIDFMTDDDGFRAHQAEVIANAGWVKGREEWGVRLDNGTAEFEIPKTSEEHARDYHEHYRAVGLGGRAVAVVRRYVTDWEQA